MTTPRRRRTEWQRARKRTAMIGIKMQQQRKNWGQEKERGRRSSSAKIAKEPQLKAKNASCGEGHCHQNLLTPPITPAQHNIIIIVSLNKNHHRLWSRQRHRRYTARMTTVVKTDEETKTPSDNDSDDNDNDTRTEEKYHKRGRRLSQQSWSHGQSSILPWESLPWIQKSSTPIES